LTKPLYGTVNAPWLGIASPVMVVDLGLP